MSASNPDVPLYREGQTLSADDLTAAVAYARDRARVHALAGHSAGIHHGCDVVARDQGGTVAYFIRPGMLTDHYGRSVIVAAPLPVPPARLARLPSGVHPVWLRYDARGYQGRRTLYEGCEDAEEIYRRLREGVAVEVGPRLLASDRSSGLTVAGASIEDPRLFLRAVDEDAPVVLDGSAPHQFFPDDPALSLIAVGAVVWQAGAPGQFLMPDDTVLALSRSLRQMAGTVTEQVLAADGVIRLRDRFAQPAPGQSIENLAQQAAIRPEDLVDEDGRLVGRELIWLEGHTRATGDMRLFGTRLELRDAGGEEAGDAPLWLRRFASPGNAAAGQDLQIAIGTESDGATRFSVGPFDDATGDVSPVLLADSAGRAGIGTGLPGTLDGHTLLVAAEDEATLSVASGPDAAARLVFTGLPPAGTDGRIEYDKANGRLHFGHGGDPDTDMPNWATLTEAGRFGIRTATPEDYDGTTNDLVVVSTLNCGITVACDPGFDAQLAFARGTDTAAERRSGWVRYRHGSDSLDFGTDATLRMTLDSLGRLGLGTSSPGAALTLADPDNGDTLEFDPDSIAARNGGAAHTLRLQPSGGAVTVHGSGSVSTRVIIDSSGRLGVGLDTPAAPLHLRSSNPELRIDTPAGSGSPRLRLSDNGAQRAALSWERGEDRVYLWTGSERCLTAEGRDLGIGIGAATPDARLHVADSVSGSAQQAGNHVALIENTSGTTNADVLALRVGAGSGTAQDGNNFITFFAGTTAIGSIEAALSGASSTVTLNTGGADFAECLPRAAGIEVIGGGKVVGLRGGVVSLDTGTAEAVFVTSACAAVVGNWQADEGGFERVALVGQVELEAEGPLAPGDLLVPSGRNDGCARRREAERDALALIVGRALGGLEAGATGAVRAAVGLHGQDVARLLEEALAAQRAEIAELRAALQALSARIGGG